MTAVSELPPSVWGDFVNLFRGEALGSGIGREVYALVTDRTKVLKIEVASASFQNAMEWETWRALQDTKWAQYLAPCHHISPCGVVLIQSRCTPLPPDREDVRLPGFLTDYKRTNYGVLDGRVVAMDYGTHLAIERGAAASRMKKA